MDFDYIRVAAQLLGGGPYSSKYGTRYRQPDLNKALFG